MIRFLLLTALLSIGGCVHFDEYIQINRDGSAKVIISYSMPVSSYQLLLDSEEVLQELNKEKQQTFRPRIFDREKMLKHFQSIPGVEVISLRVNQIDDRFKTYMNLQIKDFRQALRAGLFPYTALEKKDENYIFSALYPFNLKKTKRSTTMIKAIRQLKIKLRIKTPTAIVETTAPEKLANQATWNYSPDKVPFSQCDGRFIVKFEAKNLSFLDPEE